MSTIELEQQLEEAEAAITATAAEMSAVDVAIEAKQKTVAMQQKAYNERQQAADHALFELKRGRAGLDAAFARRAGLSIRFEKNLKAAKAARDKICSTTPSPPHNGPTDPMATADVDAGAAAGPVGQSLSPVPAGPSSLGGCVGLFAGATRAADTPKCSHNLSRRRAGKWTRCNMDAIGFGKGSRRWFIRTCNKHLTTENYTAKYIEKITSLQEKERKQMQDEDAELRRVSPEKYCKGQTKSGKPCMKPPSPQWGGYCCEGHKSQKNK